MFDLNVPLVLASASPRRAALLRALGVPFQVLPADVDERWPADADHGAAVEAIADDKASAVAARPEVGDALVLGADTVVVLGSRVLGKPAHSAEAREMLRALAGATHEVYTGVSLRHATTAVTAHEITRVTFAPLSEAEITSYVATGSPLDKAGAYGIQDDLGALFIARIEGDYYNVVGLPLHLLYRTIRARFGHLLA